MMKSNFRISAALLLVLALCIQLLTPAFAANNKGVEFTATLDKSTINVSSEAQTVVFTVKANQEIGLDSLTAHARIPEGFSINSITNEDLNFKASQHNVATGDIAWYWEYDDGNDLTYTNLIAVVTYTIPANTPAGTYTIEFEIEDISEYWATWEDGTTVSATLTIVDTSAPADPTWKKVTAAPSDWSGTYLIVYEESATAGKIFDASGTSADALAGEKSNINYKNVEIADGVITSSKAYAVTIAKSETDGYYTIKTPSGHYIGVGENKAGMNANKTTKYINAINLADGGVTITSNNGPELRFNTSDQRFRYYASTSSKYAPVSLYKLVDPACEHTEKGVASIGEGKHNVVCTACQTVIETVNCTGANIDTDCTTAEICVCGFVVTAAKEHTYDNACDASCNVCGATRTPADHVYDNACDADCNVCGATRTPADHVYANACDADCNVCGATRTPAAHVYDNACDTTCNTCGATREVSGHTGDKTPCTGKKECVVCGTEYATANDHGQGKGFYAVSNNNGTHKEYCGDCRNLINENVTCSPADGECTLCGYCKHTGTFRYSNNGDGTHNVICDVCNNTTQEKVACSDVTTKDHKCDACGYVMSTCSGGTATCVKKAECTECGQEYGDFADHAYGDLIEAQAEVHTQTELKGAVAAHYFCDVCDTYFTEGKVETTLEGLTDKAPEHVFGDWEKDETKHWKECSCGLKSEEDTHTGGTATCQAQAVCSVCNTAYGKLGDHITNPDPDSVMYIEIAGNAEQHTARYHCINCGQITKETLEDHDDELLYGRYCESCGYDFHICVHDHYVTENGKHQSVCSCGEAIGEAVACSGGTATCTEKAVCTTCKTAYGAEPAGHSFSTEWKNDGEKHWHECACGAKNEVAAHSDVTTDTDHKCDVCEKDNVTEHKHNTYGSNETQHWSICDCGQMVGEKADHDFTVGDCICGAEKPETHVCAHYEYKDITETTHQSYCSCGEKIGTAEVHTFNLEGNNKCICGRGREIKLIFVANGNEYPVGVEYGKTITSFPANPTFGKAEFEGWKDANGVDVDGNYIVTKETYVYAQWETGWVEIEGEWYYVDPTTGSYATGLKRLPYQTKEKYEGYDEDLAYAEKHNKEFIDKELAWYSFDENGKLEKDFTGIRDGKYFLNGMSPWHPGFVEVDGEWYYFIGDTENGGNKMAEGQIYVTRNAKAAGYETGNQIVFVNGKVDTTVHGIVTKGNVLYYYESGKLMAGAGLVKLEDGYIYVRSGGQVALGNYWVTTKKANGLLEGGKLYDFGTDGYLTIDPNKNGIIDGVYYKEGVPYYAGLIKIGEDYYYVRSDGQIATGKYYITKTNDVEGFYKGMKLFFGEDGKLQPVKNGIVEEDGELYYYEDNHLMYGAGLLKLEDGSFIYVRSNGQLAVGKYYITTVNEELQALGYKKGMKLIFGEDGKYFPEN